MKKTLFIACLLALLCGCSKPVEQNLYSQVTLQLELPDGRQAVSVTVDPALPGNQFRNLNTGINYPYPTFVNNQGRLQVQKGVYVIAFDGEALFADGSRARVRFSSWGSPSTAVNLMGDTESLQLKLTLLP